MKTLGERREAMRLRPNDAALLNDTAWMLATNPNASIRNGTEAVELAERALKLSVGNEPAILDTLAAAYAEAGRFSEAVAAANKALDLATQRHQETLADRLRARLTLYKAGKPFR
jgi:spermidine synthase